jgi:hypothetical protein
LSEGSPTGKSNEVAGVRMSMPTVLSAWVGRGETGAFFVDPNQEKLLIPVGFGAGAWGSGIRPEPPVKDDL